MPTPPHSLQLLAVPAALLVVRLAAAQCPDGTPAPCGPARSALPRIQVLDFEQSDTAHAYLASGLTEDLRSVLLASHAVAVVGPRAGRTAADYVLSGSVRPAGDGLMVACRMERLGTDRIVWATRLSAVGRDVPRVPRVLAAGALRAAGVRDEGRPATAETDPGTYDLVMRARYLVSRRTEPAMARAVGLARAAIARDSASPLAWASLGHALERASTWHFTIPGLGADSVLALALSATERAVELAPADPGVLVLRAQVGQHVEPTDRTASIHAFRAVLASDPLNAAAWQQLGMSLLETGDHPQALAAFRRGVTLDPGNSEMLAFLAIGLFLARQSDSAAVWAGRAVAADPTYLLARAVAGQAAFWQGRLDEAEAQFEAADRLMTSQEDRGGQLELTRVKLARGDSAGARAYVLAAAAAADTARPSVHLALAMGDGFLAIGDTARAFWWLARFQPRRDAHFQMHLRDEPAFDGVRTDPRFRSLVAP